MEEATANAVVERLRARGAFAHVHPVGVYEYSVRIVIPDGREAIWDADGAAGLEAIVLRDNVLVGLVEQIPGSESYDVDGIVDAIARADYDAPLAPRPKPTPSAAPTTPSTPATPATPAEPSHESLAARLRGGLLRRLAGK